MHLTVADGSEDTAAAAVGAAACGSRDECAMRAGAVPPSALLAAVGSVAAETAPDAYVSEVTASTWAAERYRSGLFHDFPRCVDDSGALAGLRISQSHLAVVWGDNLQYQPEDHASPLPFYRSQARPSMYTCV